MCGIIVVNKGEKEIETPRQFLEYFGFEAPMESYYKSVELDSCLCQVNIEDALKDHCVTYKKDCENYYVGLIEDVDF